MYPLNYETFDTLSFLLKRPVEFVCATPNQIKSSLVKYYGSADEAARYTEQAQLGVEGIIIGDIAVGEGGIESEQGDAPIIKMVTMMLLEAL